MKPVSPKQTNLIQGRSSPVILATINRNDWFKSHSNQSTIVMLTEKRVRNVNDWEFGFAVKLL